MIEPDRDILAYKHFTIQRNRNISGEDYYTILNRLDNKVLLMNDNVKVLAKVLYDIQKRDQKSSKGKRKT